MRRAHWLIGALASIGFTGLTVAACDSVEPGDYVVYRVAETSSSLSDGCFWQYDGAHANVRDDSSSLRTSATFVLYVGAEEQYDLDIGPVTLDGALEGESDAGEDYAFEGKSVDVEWDNPNGSGARRIATVKTSVDMSVDGELVVGTIEVKHTWACEGTGCGELPPECVETIDFVGTEVEDVQLEHEVPPGFTPGSGPGSGPGGGGPGGGGPGGAGGEGGNGGEGGGVACVSCGQLVSSGGELSADDLCESSLALYDALWACSCEGECGTVCVDNACVDMSQPSAECVSSCLNEICSSSMSACMADSGTDGA
jgi:hypothetical protein